MAAELPPVVIEITAKTEQIKAALADVERQLKQLGGATEEAARPMATFGDSLKGMAKGLIGLVALGEIVSYMKEAAHAAADDATSMALLARQMQNSTGATKAQTGAVEDQIAKLSTMAGVYDDDIRASMGTFVRTTKDSTQALALEQVALDVAAGTGKDLAAVTKAMSMAVAGNTGALNKLVPGAKDATDQIGYLRDTFSGAAATAANTDPYKRLNVIMDSLKESIGSGVLPFARALSDWLAGVVPQIQAFFDQLKNPNTVLGKSFEALITATNTFGQAFTNVVNQVSAGSGKFDALAVFLEMIARAIDYLAKQFAKIGGAIGAFKKGDWLGGLGQLSKLNPLASATDAIDSFFGKLKSKSTGLDWSNIKMPDLSGFNFKVADPKGAAAAAAALKNYQAEVKKFTKEMEADAKKAADARAKYDAAEADAYKAFYKKQEEIYAKFNDEKLKIEQKRDDDLNALEDSHAKNVLKIQSDFAKKFADIVQQSMNLMRDAFQSATAVDVGSIFASSLSASTLSSTLATQVKNGLTTVVSWWGSPAAGGGVSGLLKTLQDKLSASKMLSDNAAKLAGAGFSQNFIDQVLAQGTDVGNTMSQAILDASPDIQRQLSATFEEASTFSQHGVDALAQKLYETQGLANESLRNLWSQTTLDQKAALDDETANYVLAQKKILADFDSALKDITKARDDAMSAANDALQSSLDDAAAALKATLKEISDAIKATIKEMGNLNPKASAAAQSAVSDAGAGIISSYLPYASVNTSSGTMPFSAYDAAGPSMNINLTTQTNADPTMIATSIINGIKLNNPLILPANVAAQMGAY